MKKHVKNIIYAAPLIASMGIFCYGGYEVKQSLSMGQEEPLASLYHIESELEAAQHTKKRLHGFTGRTDDKLEKRIEELQEQKQSFESRPATIAALDERSKHSSNGINGIAVGGSASVLLLMAYSVLEGRKKKTL